jgi:hypothetical protein
LSSGWYRAVNPLPALWKVAMPMRSLLRDFKPEASLQKMTGMLNAEEQTSKEGKRFHHMRDLISILE